MILKDQTEKFINQHSPLVVCYTNFHEGYLFDKVIEAMTLLIKMFPTLGLIILGPDQYPHDVKELIKSNMLVDAFHLVGDVCHDEFMTILKRSNGTDGGG